MKKIITLKRCSIILFMLLIISPLANAQSRYKHPRVKVDKVRTEEKPVNIHKNEVIIPLEIENEPVVETNVIEPTEVATVSSKDIVVKNQKKSSHFPKLEKKIKKANKDVFTQKVKDESRLMEVKDVKKTALIGYLLWFIIVLILGIALFVLAFVFLGIIAYSLYYVFLVFGIVGLAIALFILIFGLAGII
jgi:membrane-bound ClpP family serine protease